MMANKLSLPQLREWHLSRAEHFVGMKKTHEEFATTPDAIRHNLAKEYLHRAKDYGIGAEFHKAAAELLGE